MLLVWNEKPRLKDESGLSNFQKDLKAFLVKQAVLYQKLIHEFRMKNSVQKNFFRFSCIKSLYSL